MINRKTATVDGRDTKRQNDHLTRAAAILTGGNMSEIIHLKWKNLKGIQLENEWIRVVILPELGGKIASVFYKKRQFEFAAQYQGEAYRLPEPDGDFCAYDASGLDDVFPNIVKAEVPCRGNKNVLYPDHGEIWGSRFSYEIRNEGAEPFPCLWAFHGLARYERDMELLYPKSVHSFENVLRSPELGEVGRHYPSDSRPMISGGCRATEPW